MKEIILAETASDRKQNINEIFYIYQKYTKVQKMH